MKLEDLVKDWGAFEDLVAELHKTGDVTVERNVVLSGQSGAPRQIDVVIRHKSALFEHLILVECKYWKRRVRREQVDAFVTAVRDLRAARGIIVSTKGFQQGAITQARLDGIDLFSIRELSKTEWGLPGRIFDMFLHVVQVGTPRVTFPGAQFLPRFEGAGPPEIALHFEGGEPGSANPLRGSDGHPTGESLETVVLEGAHRIVRHASEAVGVFNNEQDGNYYLRCPGTLACDPPLIIVTRTGLILAETIAMDIPVKIHQSRITFDRSDHLTFALAIEDKVTGLVRTAARRPGSLKTEVSPVVPAAVDERDPSFQNGSVAKVFLRGFHDVSEIDALTPVDLAAVSLPWLYRDPSDD